MVATLGFPDSDLGLLEWSRNLLGHIEGSPGSYGLDESDVEGYALAHAAYAAGLAACAPAVRNKTAVVAKNEARARLKDAAKRVAAKVYAAGPGVSVAQKTLLGIRPRAARTTIGRPESAPVVEVISSTAWTVSIRLRDANGARRGKAARTSGASVFSFVGEQPPADIEGWKFETSVGRVTKIDISFDNALPSGTRVWTTALWFNGRKQAGPLAPATCTNLPGGSVQQAR